jgi:type IV pilus assembly protein PilN
MIRINLIPAEETARAAGRRRDLAAGVLALGALGFVFVAAHAWQHFRIAASERRIERLKSDLAAIQGSYTEVVQMEKDQAELQEKLKVIEQLEQRKVGPVRILADLASATPDKLWLTEFSDTGGTLKLTGLGVDEQTVADYMRRLDALPFLTRVDLDETSQVAQDGAKLKKFKIQAQVDYAAAAPHGSQTASKPAGGRP